nr:MAG TPA: hypothetical protein [Caudoviricetes sp.]
MEDEKSEFVSVFSPFLKGFLISPTIFFVASATLFTPSLTFCPAC